jgi:polar amino acid transport system permease protein
LSLRGLIALLVANTAVGLYFFVNSTFYRSANLFIDAAAMTVKLTVCAAILAFIFALLSGLGRYAGGWATKTLSTFYIELFRGSSALVQLFWLFYVLPLFGPRIDPFFAGVLGVALNMGAYGGVVVEAALRSVPRGQQEAAVALNMSRTQILARITIPQALLFMIPPCGNLFIQLFKLTALVSFIGVSDLTYMANQLNQTTYRTTEIFMIILSFYFSLGLCITIFMKWLSIKAGAQTGEYGR